MYMYVYIYIHKYIYIYIYIYIYTLPQYAHCNKVVQLVNLPPILHNENVEGKAHKIYAKFVAPTIVKEPTERTRSTIFNFNDFFLILSSIVFFKVQMLNRVIAETIFS